LGIGVVVSARRKISLVIDIVIDVSSVKKEAICVVEGMYVVGGITKNENFVIAVFPVNIRRNKAFGIGIGIVVGSVKKESYWHCQWHWKSAWHNKKQHDIGVGIAVGGEKKKAFSFGMDILLVAVG